MKLFNDIPKLFNYITSDETKLSYSYALVIKRLGFFISLMFHWLRASNSGEVIEIYKSTPHKRTLIKYENSITSSRHFKVDNFDFSLLMTKIKIKVLIQLYAAILLERKIVIVTGDVWNNAIIIETLQTLLYPMKWNLFSVAVITTDTHEFLDAPFPYIIGMSQDTWAEIKPSRWRALPDDIFVVDIETNKIQIKEPLPPLPPTFAGILENILDQHLSKYRKMEKSSKVSKQELEEFWIKTSMSIKQEFLYFLIFLMNDFVECFKNYGNKEGLDDAPIISWIADIFKYEKYLKNIYKSSDFSPEFTSRFIHTQLFTQLIEHYYTPETSSTNASSDIASNQWADNRMLYFKKLLKEFEKGGLRGLRSMQKSEINVVLDDYLHPHEISIEQAYCHYTDLLSNKLRIHKYENSTFRDYNHISEQVPSAKNIRLLSWIKKSDWIEMNDFYEEILGLSTKEMTMSENVSIPDINKRKLCNIEVLTNKRCQSDIQQFGNQSSDSPNIPQSEEIIGNFHTCNSKIENSSKIQRRSKYEFSVQNNIRSPSYSSNKYNTPSGDKFMKDSHGKYFKNEWTFDVKSRGSHNINKSIEFKRNAGSISLEKDNQQMNLQFAHPERVKTLKALKSASNKSSMNNLMKGSKIDAFAFPDRGKYINKKGEEIANFDIDSDQNSEDIEASDSNTKQIDSSSIL